MKVSYGGFYSDIGKSFLETVSKVDKNRPADNTRDATDFFDVNVYNVKFDLLTYTHVLSTDPEIL